MALVTRASLAAAALSWTQAEIDAVVPANGLDADEVQPVVSTQEMALWWLTYGAQALPESLAEFVLWCLQTSDTDGVLVLPSGTVVVINGFIGGSVSQATMESAWVTWADGGMWAAGWLEDMVWAATIRLAEGARELTPGDEATKEAAYQAKLLSAVNQLVIILMAE